MMTATERQLFQALVEIVHELGWRIIIPADQDSENPDDVRGMVIGEANYLEYISVRLGGSFAVNEEVEQ